MSPLRQRMINDMQLRRLSDKTITTYIHHVATFAQYFHKSPHLISAEEIRSYLLYLIHEKQVSWSTYNQTVCALRFLYRHTLRSAHVIPDLPFPRREYALPVILSLEEVLRFLSAITSLKYRAILMTTYAAGLRLSEVMHLRVADIDSQRMVIHVRQGKGRKDRYVMLSPVLLQVLRLYWHAARPTDWLFPGHLPGQPISGSAIQCACKRAAQDAGLTKKISVRTLRHCARHPPARSWGQHSPHPDAIGASECAHHATLHAHLDGDGLRRHLSARPAGTLWHTNPER